MNKINGFKRFGGCIVYVLFTLIAQRNDNGMIKISNKCSLKSELILFIFRVDVDTPLLSVFDMVNW